MTASSVFPAFIRAEYDPTAGGFPAFERAADTAFGRAESRAKQFASNMAEVDRVVSGALATPRNAGGSLDLGVPALREAAAAAEARAIAAREVATATRLAAEAEGDYSTRARLAIAASQALAREEEQAAAAARSHATAAEQVQAQLNRQASATQAVVTASSRGTTAMAAMTNSARANRFAYLQLGQQLQDVAIQAQLGTNPLIILTQQGTQAAFALSGLGGKIGTVARFLSTPLVSAALAAVTAIALLSNAFKANSEEAGKVALATNELANAQSALGDLFNLTTGKIESQNEVLRLNARLMANNLRAEALAKEATSNSALTGARDYTVLGRVAGFFNRAPGVGGQNPFARAGGDPAARDPINQLLAGRMTSEQALKSVSSLSDSAFAGSGATKDEVLKAILDRAAVKANRQLADQIDESLDSGVLNPALRRKDKKKDTSAADAQRLSEFAETAADKVARINEQWDDQPRLIDRAKQAGRQLDDVITDINFRLKDPKLSDAQRKSLEETKKSADTTRAVIERGLTRPYRDLLDTQSQQLVIQDLVLRGKQAEADATATILSLEKQMGPLDAARRQAILNNVIALQQQSREIEIQRQQQQAYLNAVSSTQEAIRQGFASLRRDGANALGGFVKSVRLTFDNLVADVLTENLFGDLFRDMQDRITGANQVKDANDILRDALAAAASKVEQFGNVVAAAANATAGAPVAAANDNGATAAADEVIVTARRYQTDPAAFLGQTFTKILGRFLSEDLAKKIGERVGQAVEGAGYGQIAGGLVLGGKNNALGSSLGGAIGNIAGKELAKGAFGTALGSISSALDSLGSIAGGLLGGALGGLFSSTKKGVASIGVDSSGNLVMTGLTGNSGKRKQAASEGADATISSIERIAEALGGTVNASRGSVSIGVRDGNYRVDPTGRGMTKLKNGAIDFGSDAESAVRAATLNLIQDGVIEGLRAGTKRLLTQGKDLDAALDKALRFEGVFTRYREMTDPVGAAIDAVNKEFTSLIKIFKEAGATTEELGQLEAVYNSDRKKAAEEAAKAVTGSLQDLLDGIRIGDSGYSLRTRAANARAAYDPLAARVAAGDTSAFDDFSAAAQTLIDIQRQLNGSQAPYFDVLKEVESLTSKALEDQNKLIDSANASKGLFDTTPVVSATEKQTQAIIDALNGQLNAANNNDGKIISLLDQIRAGLINSGNYRLASLGNF